MTQIIKNYRNDPEGHLQIIDPYSMEFLVQSQTNFHENYALNLGLECCECNDRVHMSAYVGCTHVIGSGVKTFEDITIIERRDIFTCCT